MTHERIALDFDSTIAATTDVAFELLGEPDYSYEDITSWEWPVNQFGETRFLTACWHTWTLRPLEVSPLEDNLAETIATLRDNNTVDIVTAHPDYPGITDGKKHWLDHHDIEVDNFVRVDGPKSEYDYDIYIDDKPTLPIDVNETRETATVYLRDQPYNRDAAGDYTRITSLAEVSL